MATTVLQHTLVSAEVQPLIPPSSGNQGSMAGCDFQSDQSGTGTTRSAMENTAGATEKYLKELQSDYAKLSEVAKTVEFPHALRLVELEMKNVTFNSKKRGISVSGLPEPKGPVVTLTEMVMIPMENPGYNFVGRILGPRGMSVKQLEQETGCKINVEGRGTRKGNRANTEQAENTTEEEKPYVVVSCEDTANRAALKLKRAVDELQCILHPTEPKGDEFKRKQLMELAIINGTYRPPGFFKIAQHQLAMQRQPFQGYPVQYAAPSVYPSSSYGGAPMFQHKFL